MIHASQMIKKSHRKSFKQNWKTINNQLIIIHLVVLKQMVKLNANG